MELLATDTRQLPLTQGARCGLSWFFSVFFLERFDSGDSGAFSWDNSTDIRGAPFGGSVLFAFFICLWETWS